MVIVYRAIILILYGWAMVQPALSCMVTPITLRYGHDEAIEDAEWIALARMTGREELSPDHIDYHFDVIEYLKGSGPQQIVHSDMRVTFTGYDWKYTSQPAEANYYGHRASSFWMDGLRHGPDNSCGITPTFLKGMQFLIFGPHEYHMGYENVTDKDDLWLQYVRDRLSNPSTAQKPFPVKSKTYFSEAEAVVRISAQWNDGQVAWQQDVMKGPDLPYAHMFLVSPQAYFASRLDPICYDFVMGLELDESSEQEPKPLDRPKQLDWLFVFQFVPSERVQLRQSLWCAGGKKRWIRLFGRVGRFLQNRVERFYGER
jgi:hypothetical protein